MKLMKFLLLFLCICLEAGEPVTNYLNTQCAHLSSKIKHLDAAFMVRLQEQRDVHELKAACEREGIVLREYDQFNALPMEVMSQFCSNVVSPYLLTQILSHLSIYKYCLEHDLSSVLVIEDHAKLEKRGVELEGLLEEASSLKKPWDILYTDQDYHDPKTGAFIVPRLAHIPENKEKVTKRLSKIHCRYGTASYVISKSGMKKIINYFEKKWDNLPFDQIVFNIPNLNIYGPNFDIITNEYQLGTKSEKVAAGQNKKPFAHKIGEEFWIEPSELLSYDRFDILPKYIFAKYTLQNYDTSWHVDLYRSHLEKWVKCYNTKPLKIGFDDFLNSFNTLLQSIQTQGFDEEYAIGVNHLHTPWNGAHRIGTCLALNKPVKAKAIEKRPSQNLTAKVFRENYHLEEKYLDHMAFEYAKLKKNTFITCLYPVGYEHREEVEKILKKYGALVHEKDIWLTPSGMLEFIRLVYTGEWWTGSHIDDFKHSRGKILLTFPESLRTKYPVKVYLYECESKAVATKAKEEVRQLCKKGNEVIHINDTHEQTKLIAATLFNQNSVNFMNKKKLVECKNFDQLFANLKRFIKNNKLDSELLCVDTSAVLSAYGLRDCVDIDILHRDPLPRSFKDHKIDSHNRYLRYHPLSLDEILFNPDCHFYYEGVKFLKPELVKQMKKNRSHEKDFKDIELINSISL